MLAIVSGNNREIIERGRRPWIDYAFTYPDGTSSGRSRAQNLPSGRLEVARPILRDRSEGWAACPRGFELVINPS